MASSVSAPRGTPAEIVNKLNREINRTAADPKLRRHFADLGATVFTGSPQDFAKFLGMEADKSGRVIRAANIRAE
jgi:tripartite-type tricarboxylate transporter receptor subunit TctC